MISGTLKNPPPELPWASLLFLGQIQRTVYMRIIKSSQGGETTRETSCLTLMQVIVTLAGGTTFSNVSTLARISGQLLAYHE